MITRKSVKVVKAKSAKIAVVCGRAHAREGCLKVFLTVGDTTRWEKLVGDAVISSDASKKKLPRFWENLPRFLKKLRHLLVNLRCYFLAP